MRTFLVVTLFLFVAFQVTTAGETVVVGYVYSSIDKSPLPSVNVYFEGTQTGTQTDDEGFYILRNTGPENKLVFSNIGYKNQVITIRPGEPVSTTVYLREDIRALQELLVFPGVNPANLLMKKVREAAAANDIHNTSLTLQSQDEELILMPSGNNDLSRRFDKWVSGMIDERDSSLFIPLYLAQALYLHKGRKVQNTLNRSAVASPENLMILMEKLSGSLKTELNFYNNNLMMFGRNVISPLSSAGNAFYRYYLMDSIAGKNGKQYFVRFRTKNPKNLAFNGEMYIDSSTLAITQISATLPRQANINYVNELSVSQHFSPRGIVWIPESTELKLGLNYTVQVDSTTFVPELYVYKKVSTTLSDSAIYNGEGFAGSAFQKEELEYKLAELNDIPLMKTARWIADIVITGYAQLGKLDLGKVYQLGRLTDQEGLRLNIPLRTNELFAPNFTFGGYWGYGMASKSHYYSVFTGLKLPFKRKTVLRGGYTDDKRRTDYEYNDYMVKENPLLSGDVDIANTIISFTSTDRLNKRREWNISLSHDWNDDVETSLHFRSNRYFENNQLPFVSISGTDPDFLHQSLTLVTRFSSRERTYEDHLDRIYVQNERPVLYLIAEAGATNPYGKTTNYAKLLMKYKHKVLFSTGQWMYSVDAGWLLGDVPYNLYFNQGSGRAVLHRRLHFNLMEYMEYSYDKYISTHHELMFNGIILNYIPGIKNFNLRELFTFKAIYGGMNPQRTTIYDMPSTLTYTSKPYAELGVGLSNIFKVGSLQSVWRITDRDKPGVSRWGLIAGIRFNF